MPARTTRCRRFGRPGRGTRPRPRHAARHARLRDVDPGRPAAAHPLDESLRCRILQPSLAGWSDTIDTTVRRSATGGGLGPLPLLAFSADPFIDPNQGRPIFRPRIDTMLVHLGHPLMKKAVNWLTQRRYPAAALGRIGPAGRLALDRSVWKGACRR
jgi:hypothetical protein